MKNALMTRGSVGYGINVAALPPLQWRRYVKSLLNNDIDDDDNALKQHIMHNAPDSLSSSSAAPSSDEQDGVSVAGITGAATLLRA